MKVLESSTTQGKPWFMGKKAHHMYQWQAKGKANPLHLVKKPYNYPGRGKYGYTLDRYVCTLCGDNFIDGKRVRRDVTLMQGRSNTLRVRYDPMCL